MLLNLLEDYKNDKTKNDFLHILIALKAQLFHILEVSER